MKTVPFPTFLLNTVRYPVPGQINLSQTDINNHFRTSFLKEEKSLFLVVVVIETMLHNNTGRHNKLIKVMF